MSENTTLPQSLQSGAERLESRIHAKTLAKLALLCSLLFLISDLLMASIAPEAAPFFSAVKQAGFLPACLLILEFLLPAAACVTLLIALTEEDWRSSVWFPVSMLLYAGLLLCMLLERITGQTAYLFVELELLLGGALLASVVVLAVLSLCKKQIDTPAAVVGVIHLLFWIGYSVFLLSGFFGAGGEHYGAIPVSRDGVVFKALSSVFASQNLQNGDFGLSGLLYLTQLFWPFLFFAALVVRATPHRSRKSALRMLVLLAMLTAMEIVLSRFLSINAWNLKIGFSFVPIVIAAILYGPIGGMCVAALGDFVGAILFPIGPYFPGFTLTALLTGLVFVLFLFKKKEKTKWYAVGVILSVLINQLVFSLLLNTYWISVLYGNPYFATLLSRIPQCAILIPVQIAMIFAIAPALRRLSGRITAS